MQTGIKLTIDYAFKKIFGSEKNKDLLISLINSILEYYENKKIDDIEIINPYSEKDFADDKLSILDVKAKDEHGTIYDIEVQVIFQHYFCKRVLHYASRLFTSQLKKGDGYSMLNPVISIVFMDCIMFPEHSSYCNRFMLKNDDSSLVLSNDMVFYVFELPKFKDELDKIKSDLDKWLHLLKNSNTIDTNLLPDYILNSNTFNKAFEEVKVMGLSKTERTKYEERQKYYHDIATLKDEGYALGRIAGIKEGKLEGIKEGEKMLENMFNEGILTKEQYLAKLKQLYNNIN